MLMLKTLLPPCASFSTLSSCDDADFLLFDNFPGVVSPMISPSTGIGKPPVIGSGNWKTFAASAANVVSGDGKLALNVDNGNAYCEFALDEIPGEIGCVFEF